MGHLSLQLSNPLLQPLGLQRTAVWSAAASAAGRSSGWSATAVRASHRSTATGRASAWDAAAERASVWICLERRL
jgi:hypothetical protein